MAKSVLVQSSLAKKYWMALTGLFLCVFLLGHVAGNLQLFLPDGSLQFNAYAKFMTTNPLVKILSYLTYFSILFHAIDGILLTLQNRKARGNNSYAKNNTAANSTWASQNMAVLGTVLLVFIVTHMTNFWAKMHFAEMPLDAAGNKDLYRITVEFFTNKEFGLYAVVFYVLAMLALAFHLSHGFLSAFQSLGLRHKKYTPILAKLGLAFAWLVPLLFALMPIYLFISK
jgi:succinate dehydrogenase / fumarate reductase cytochrome b subunit